MQPIVSEDTCLNMRLITTQQKHLHFFVSTSGFSLTSGEFKTPNSSHAFTVSSYTIFPDADLHLESC